MKDAPLNRPDIVSRYRKYVPQLMSVEGFYEYATQVFDLLFATPVGSSLKVATKDPNRLLWLLVSIGAFMHSYDKLNEFEFNEDFTLLKRIPPLTNFIYP